MWGYLEAVLGLAALCAGWVFFQCWLEQIDSDGRRIEDSRGCGNSCSGKCGKIDPARGKTTNHANRCE